MKVIYLYTYRKTYFTNSWLHTTPLITIEGVVRELRWELWSSIPIDRTPSGEIYYTDLIYSK